VTPRRGLSLGMSSGLYGRLKSRLNWPGSSRKGSTHSLGHFRAGVLTFDNLQETCDALASPHLDRSNPQSKEAVGDEKGTVVSINDVPCDIIRKLRNSTSPQAGKAKRLALLVPTGFVVVVGLFSVVAACRRQPTYSVFSREMIVACRWSGRRSPRSQGLEPPHRLDGGKDCPACERDR
jgi:hypothetical protein